MSTKSEIAAMEKRERTCAFRLDGMPYTRREFYWLLISKGQTRTLSSLPIRYKKRLAKEENIHHDSSFVGVLYSTPAGNVWAVVPDSN